MISRTKLWRSPIFIAVIWYLQILLAKYWSISITQVIQVVFKVCARHKPYKNVRSGKWHAWTSGAILANTSMHLKRLALKFTAIVCFGSFPGGEFVVPCPKVKFPFQRGDVIFIKSSLLAHFVTEWEPFNLPNGDRDPDFPSSTLSTKKIVD